MSACCYKEEESKTEFNFGEEDASALKPNKEMSCFESQADTNAISHPINQHTTPINTQ